MRGGDLLQENPSDIKGIFGCALRFGLDLNNDTVTSDAEDAHPCSVLAMIGIAI